MTATSQPWAPDLRSGDYAHWTIPAHLWSGAKHSEDTISISCEVGEWCGCTEIDQTINRDLTDADVASIRAEFNIQSA